MRRDAAVGYGTKACRESRATCENSWSADGDGINDKLPERRVRELKDALARNRLQGRRPLV